MVDHLACAQRYRFKAGECEQSAKGVTSPLFAKCYIELAKLFLSIATNEENFAHREMAANQQANENLISQMGAP
jgi:hypothetical protein